MTRTLALMLAAVILLIAPITEGRAQCPSQDSDDQKLEVLNRPLEHNDHDAVECVFALMDDLSGRGDQRVLPLLIRNLDLEQTKQIFFNITRYPGYPYLAIGYLARFGDKAEPFLLDAIVRSSLASSLSENAIRTLMLINAGDTPEGIRKLLARAAKEKGEAATKMRVAAEYAVSFCYSKERQACEDMIWPKHLRDLPHPPPK